MDQVELKYTAQQNKLNFICIERERTICTSIVPAYPNCPFFQAKLYRLVKSNFQTLQYATTNIY